MVFIFTYVYLNIFMIYLELNLYVNAVSST